MNKNIHKMEDIDDEIEALEKKLGIFDSKNIKDTLKKELGKDGLFDLIDIPYFEDENNSNNKKMKQEIIDENEMIEEEEEDEEISDNNQSDEKEFKNDSIIFNYLNSKKIKEIKSIQELSKNIEKKIQQLDEETQKNLIKNLSERYINDLIESSEFNTKLLFSLTYIYLINLYSCENHCIIEFIINSLKNLNDLGIKQIYFFSYLYLLYFIDEDIFLEKLKNNININNYLEIISLVGPIIRKRNPKIILEIIKIIKNIQNKDLYYERLLQLINNIKNNKNIESKHVEKYLYLSKCLKKIIKKSKGKFIPLLKYDLLKDIKDNNYNNIEIIIQKKNFIKSQSIGNKNLSEEELKLIEKAKKLNFISFKEPLIFSQIFKSSNYIEAANNIFNLKLHKNKKPIVIKLIIKLILKEKDLNEFYIYFINKLTEICPEYKFILHYELNDFINKILKKLKKEDLLKITKFIVKLLSLKQYNYKLIKNIFLNEDDSKKIIFLKKSIMLYIIKLINYKDLKSLFFIKNNDDFKEYLKNYLIDFSKNILKGKFQEKIDEINSFLN